MKTIISTMGIIFLGMWVSLVYSQNDETISSDSTQKAPTNNVSIVESDSDQRSIVDSLEAIISARETELTKLKKRSAIARKSEKKSHKELKKYQKQARESEKKNVLIGILSALGGALAVALAWIST